MAEIMLGSLTQGGNIRFFHVSFHLMPPKTQTRKRFSKNARKQRSITALETAPAKKTPHRAALSGGQQKGPHVAMGAEGNS